nr:iron ABC transporter permease [Rubrobacter aplysinae]
MRRPSGKVTSGKVTLRTSWFPVSLKVDLRAVAVISALAALAFAGTVAHLAVGEYPISLLDVARTLLGLQTGDPSNAFIVETLRLPRALVALTVGAALAVSGALLQGLTRNPLAAPDIIGINAGAALVAVTLIVALPSVSSVYLPPAAFCGALMVALLLYLLAWRGHSSPMRLILIGIGLSAMAQALTWLMIVSGNVQELSRALVWLTGSVYARGWDELWALLPWVAVLVPFALLHARHLNALGLGDEVATGLGSRVELSRGLLLLASAGLAAAGVATAGTMVFVGLVAPHIARGLVGPPAGALIPTAAVTGAALVVLSDLAGRVLFAPTEIPAGIVTAVLGAPYFLYLLYRNRNK